MQRLNHCTVLIEIDPRSSIKIFYLEKTASQPQFLIQVALMWLEGVKFNREHFISSRRNKWKGTNIWLSISIADWEKVGKDLSEPSLICICHWNVTWMFWPHTRIMNTMVHNSETHETGKTKEAVTFQFFPQLPALKSMNSVHFMLVPVCKTS